MTRIEDRPEGVLATLKVRREDEVLPWLLSWGAGVRVLEPQSMRERITEELKRMTNHYRNG